MTIDLTDKHIGVILPEGQDRVAILARGKLFYNVRPDNVLFSGSVELPPGNWKILCDSKSMTEEQAAEITELGHDHGYKNYNAKGAELTWTNTALESFRSLVESKGYYLENPLGKEPEKFEIVPVSITLPACCQNFDKNGSCCNNPIAEQGQEWDKIITSDWYRWQEAQSKVIRLLVVLEKV